MDSFETFNNNEVDELSGDRKKIRDGYAMLSQLRGEAVHAQAMTGIYNSLDETIETHVSLKRENDRLKKEIERLEEEIEELEEKLNEQREKHPKD